MKILKFIGKVLLALLALLIAVILLFCSPSSLPKIMFV